MTLSEHELTSRLAAMDDKQVGQRSFAVVNVVLAFLKWNLHFCHENTDLVFEWLDDIYGCAGFFTFTHEFFGSALMYLSSNFFNDPTLTPDTRKTLESVFFRFVGHKNFR